MDILVLDTTFNAIFVLDVVESLIWTDRYNKAGDFEIYTPVTEDLLRVMQADNYLYRSDSEHLMIIEDREIKSDVEDGDHLIIRGRSLETVLEWRIIWNQTIIEGTFVDVVTKLINENIINPGLVERKLDRLVYTAPTDEAITSIKDLDYQFYGENLLDVIEDLCEEYGVGFKVVLEDPNSADTKFALSFYMGKDRSYSQNENPYVVFSKDFDNIYNSNYLESKKTWKTTALVGGEGEGASKKTVVVNPNNATGMNRREIWVDASSVSTDAQGVKLTDKQYNAQLTSEGKKALAKTIVTKDFEGEVDVNHMFVYGKDFFMGDIVQIKNEFGEESDARIEEIIFSSNNEGNKVIPTFVMVPEKGETE